MNWEDKYDNYIAYEDEQEKTNDDEYIDRINYEKRLNELEKEFSAIEYESKMAQQMIDSLYNTKN